MFADGFSGEGICHTASIESPTHTNANVSNSRIPSPSNTGPPPPCKSLQQSEEISGRGALIELNASCFVTMYKRSLVLGIAAQTELYQHSPLTVCSIIALVCIYRTTHAHTMQQGMFQCIPSLSVPRNRGPDSFCGPPGRTRRIPDSCVPAGPRSHNPRRRCPWAIPASRGGTAGFRRGYWAWKAAQKKTWLRLFSFAVSSRISSFCSVNFGRRRDDTRLCSWWCIGGAVCACSAREYGSRQLRVCHQYVGCV